jgi:thiamine-monophosphate kinase
MIGLEAARAGNDDDAVAYLRPDARLAEGQALAPHVTAMMDISDGLLLDAWRMARASKTRLSLQSTAVPIAVPENRRDEAMRWGEDFELLFTAPPGTALPVPATRIGTVCAGSGIELDAEILAGPEGLGYSHG